VHETFQPETETTVFGLETETMSRDLISLGKPIMHGPHNRDVHETFQPETETKKFSPETETLSNYFETTPRQPSVEAGPRRDNGTSRDETSETETTSLVSKNVRMIG
jgi:hypothetical protein